MFSEKSQRRPGHSRTEFGVELDVNTWQVGRLFGASSIARPLIDEFATGLNADQKEAILVKYRSFRQAVENAARFSVPADKVRKGYMVAASEVFGVSKVSNSCGLTRPLLEEHQEVVYRLLDYYCINPSCKCGETHLSVIRAHKDFAASDKPWITVRLHFEGKVKVSDVTGSLIPGRAMGISKRGTGGSRIRADGFSRARRNKSPVPCLRVFLHFYLRADMCRRGLRQEIRDQE